MTRSSSQERYVPTAQEIAATSASRGAGAGSLVDQMAAIAAREQNVLWDEVLEIAGRAGHPEPGDAGRLFELCKSVGLSFSDVEGLTRLVSHLMECDAYQAYLAAHPVENPMQAISDVETWRTEQKLEIDRKAKLKLAPLMQQQAAHRNQISTGQEAGSRRVRFTNGIQALRAGNLEDARRHFARAKEEQLMNYPRLPEA